MDKFLVEIFVPVLGKRWDMFVSANSKIYYVIQTLINYMDTLDANLDFVNMECTLSNQVNGVVFKQNMTVYEAGIMNGSKLILM